MFELTGLALTLAVLGYGAFWDFKCRLVWDGVWVFGFVLGLCFSLVNVLFFGLSWLSFCSSFLVSLVLGFGLYFFGFFGEADFKALVFVGLTLPGFGFSFFEGLLGFRVWFVLEIFVLSVFLTLIYPLNVCLLNIKDAFKAKKPFNELKTSFAEKIFLYFTARKINLSGLEGSLKYILAEKLEFKNQAYIRKPKSFLKPNSDLNQILFMAEKNPQIYNNHIYAQPTIPFVGFIFLSFFTNFIGYIWNFFGFL